MERRHVVVQGLVQGVGFRYAVERQARSRGVVGWVKNRADGAVEVVLEGERVDVEALIDFCRRGPRGAQVSGIHVAEESVEGLIDFRVTG